jgi:uncharacterized membrane protein
MAGVINAGINYGNKALSGLIRDEAMQAELDKANSDRETAEKAQKANMKATMTATGAMVGAYAGAETGLAAGGPYGALAGAAIGFLLGNLY